MRHQAARHPRGVWPRVRWPVRVRFADIGLENRDVALPIVSDSTAYAEQRPHLASVAVQPVADRHRYARCRTRLNPSAFDLMTVQAFSFVRVGCRAVARRASSRCARPCRADVRRQCGDAGESFTTVGGVGAVAASIRPMTTPMISTSSVRVSNRMARCLRLLLSGRSSTVVGSMPCTRLSTTSSAMRAATPESLSARCAERYARRIGRRSRRSTGSSAAASCRSRRPSPASCGSSTAWARRRPQRCAGGARASELSVLSRAMLCRCVCASRLRSPFADIGEENGIDRPRGANGALAYAGVRLQVARPDARRWNSRHCCAPICRALMRTACALMTDRPHHLAQAEL